MSIGLTLSSQPGG